MLAKWKGKGATTNKRPAQELTTQGPKKKKTIKKQIILQSIV